MTNNLNLGKIHIYTGDGKGKTTAAIGLALRAAGAGFKVCLIQFLKARTSAELILLDKVKNIKIFRFGNKQYIYKKAKPADKNKALQALQKSQEIIKSKKYNLVILDEINLAKFFNLITEQQLVQIIKNKPKNLELVLTGRKFDKKIIKLADYVTEMKEIKHPYKSGLLARKGIEY